MNLTLGEIAKLVRGSLVGESSVSIHGVSGIKEALAGEITFLANQKYVSHLEITKASAIIIGASDPIPQGKNVLICQNPSLAFSQIVEALNPGRNGLAEEGVHPTAVLGKGVRLGQKVSIGPHVVLEEGVVIGDRTQVRAGSFIGYESQLGADVLIYPNVTIREKSQVGDRVIIHSGTVVGSDGFGYETVKGIHHKIPQIGYVEIGNDVELGANVTVDRARFGVTKIGQGTKVDNLVQIAHNVEIGEHCMIVAQVGISGTTKLGHHVTLAGQVGVVGHIEIGDHAVVAAQAGVSKSLPGSQIYGGSPAVTLQEWKRQIAYLQRMDRLVGRVKELEKKLEVLELKKS